MHLDDLTQSASLRGRLGPSSGEITLGLVLMGGGARTAYQAGVLQALATLLKEQSVQTHTRSHNTHARPHSEMHKAFPFQVLVGTSAGALNATYLASKAIDGLKALQGLGEFWHGQ